MILNIDLETRATVDLRRSGVYPYAEHPNTAVICAAWALGDEEPNIWCPGDPIPERLREHVEGGGECHAHSAQFERVIIRDLMGPRYGFPVPDDSQWHCTAAEAAAMSLPRSLGQLSRVLKVEHEKDDEGHRLMLRMCKPRSIDPDGAIHWWDEEDPEKLAQLIEYCRQDVRAERACAKKLRRLGRMERQVYLLDQRINDRGVRLDVPLIEAAQGVVDHEIEKANAELAEVTDGQVTAVTQVAQLTEFTGLPNVRKATVRDALEKGTAYEVGPDTWDSPEHDLTDAQLRALELRQEAGKSSTSKLKSMQEVICADERARGLFLYHGANTGRWSGKLIQPQNFPRPEVSSPERAIPLILDGEADRLANPMSVVTSLLRGMLTASPGSRLLAGDFGQIEARVVCWLGGEMFDKRDYERMGSLIYEVPVESIGKEDPERQVGKGAVLGCGFQMGAPTFRDQVHRQTGIWLTDEQAVRGVEGYRTAKAGVKQYWYDVEEAAMEAVANPGRVVAVGPLQNVRYVVRGQFLWAILPSGRPLAYALPSLKQRTIRWRDIKGESHEARKLGLQYMGVDSRTRKWTSQHLYGGLLTENNTQAIARDLLALAMLRLERAGYGVPVLHSHDEAVCDTAFGSLEEYMEIMRQTPAWAEGLTVEVEGWEGQRYRK